MFQSQPNRHISSSSKNFCTSGCDVFREGCDKKCHELKTIFSCARASHSSQKCDTCDASHRLSPEKVTNVTTLPQIWDGKLGRNPGKTDPKGQCISDNAAHSLPRIRLWAGKLLMALMWSSLKGQCISDNAAHSISPMHIRAGKMLMALMWSSRMGRCISDNGALPLTCLLFLRESGRGHHEARVGLMYKYIYVYVCT